MYRWDYSYQVVWIPARLRRLRRANGPEFAVLRLAFQERCTTKRTLHAGSPNIAEHNTAKFRCQAMRLFPGSTKRLRLWTSQAWTELIHILFPGRRGKPG